LFETAEIRYDVVYSVGIVFVDRELQQLGGIVEAGAEFVQGENHVFQPRTLLAKRLCALRIIPDIGLLEFAPDFRQPFRLVVVVKGTSSTQSSVRRGRRDVV
jgi:hypothetical protein